MTADGYPRDPMLCPRCGNGDFLVLRNGAIICADEDCHAEYGQLAAARVSQPETVAVPGGIVCSACLTEACAQGILLCEDARHAGITIRGHREPAG